MSLQSHCTTLSQNQAIRETVIGQDLISVRNLYTNFCKCLASRTIEFSKAFQLIYAKELITTGTMVIWLLKK